MKSRIAASVLGLGLFLSACDDGLSEARSEACRSYCEKLEVCDDRTDVSGCVQHCANQLVRSDAFLAARATCAERGSCNSFQGEVGAMGEDSCRTGSRCALNDCTGDELAMQRPSNAQVTYCASVVNKLNACDRTLEPPTLEAHCLELVPTLSEGFLAAVQACIESDCSQVQPCLARASDQYNTELSLYPNKSLAPAL